jgi:hypothetical protein
MNYNGNACPCCLKSLNSTLLPVGCDIKDIYFLGTGYQFYFHYVKYIGIFISSNLIIKYFL